LLEIWGMMKGEEGNNRIKLGEKVDRIADV
jgi:hypothetical protein